MLENGSKSSTPQGSFSNLQLYCREKYAPVKRKIKGFDSYYYSVKKKLDKFRKTFNWNALDLLACNTAFFVLAARRRHLASLPGGTNLIRGRAIGPGISR